MSTTIAVSGMACEHCEDRVASALRAVETVEAVEVDRAAGRATVEGTAAVDDLVAAVEEAGYAARAS